MLFPRLALGRVLAFAACCWLLSGRPAQAAPPAPDLLKQPLVDPSLVLMRAVTHGPKFHWFGYYDKEQIDPSGRYLLATEVGFESRSPRPDDVVKVGMVDLADGDRWIELGESRAWCWQQGCMLQWRPGSDREILFNDREGDHFVCRVLDVKTRKLRTLPMAIDHLSPDGKQALCCDFRRIQHMRAGYGYAGVEDPNKDTRAPENAGVWRMDLETGRTQLLVSIATIAKIPYPQSTPRDNHYVNHVQWSPDGKRFLMFNRWIGGVRGMPTRVFTASAVDGSDIRLLVATDASHYLWRDPDNVLFWANNYRLYADDGSGEPKDTLWIAPNGHPNYIPGTNHQWIVTDTYPQGLKREQVLYLFHLPTGRAFVLGRFHSPKEYTGEWRCDLHPRISRDGKFVTIDSPHGGNGRQEYLFDISRIIAGEGISKEAAAQPTSAPGRESLETSSPSTEQAEAARRFDELQLRLAELRRQYAPYLRSLPKPLAVRSQTPLASQWRTRFEVAQSKDGVRPEPPDWYREDLDDSDWEPTTVPEWRYTGESYRQPISCILWYRTHFRAPGPSGSPVRGQRTFLVFGGVDWEAQVWLNGKKIGGHKVYYEPFRFDVTGVLKEDNTLAVRVIDGPRFGEPRAYWSLFPLVPAKEQRYVRDKACSLGGYRNQDLHIGSGFGIHREVYLESASRISLAGVFARSDLEKQEATVTVETDASEAGRASLEVQILPENFEGRSHRAEIACDVPQGSGKQTVIVPMPDAQLWAPESPYLYRCRVICRPAPAAGSSDSATQTGETASPVLDAQDVVFGCRAFELVSRQRPRGGLPEGMFLLNGQPVYLRGTNIQGLNALWYWRQTDRLIDTVLMLKAAHFNTVRACQHVCYPEVRELLDRLGIMSEQDQGSGRPTSHLQEELTLAGTALARVCYNNPGVVLLSFGNETHFDPTAVIRAVLAVDPERIMKPISGNYYPKGGPLYPISEELWASVVHDFHDYSAWYSDAGKLWTLSAVREPGRLVTVGEYGAEALDSYDTMTRHYPTHWRAIPPADADVLWGQAQVEKADVRQLVGFRGRKPANLGQYIEASQNYQADVVTEVTKGFRLSPRSISGYFQFHFIDVPPAGWPKSIVSHDLMPKKAYYAMARVNQPLVPLPQLLERGQVMELWVANDLPEAFARCQVKWTVVKAGAALLSGEQTADVPASNAVTVGRVSLAPIPADADVVTIRLTLSDAEGKLLSSYEQGVFLRLWRDREKVFGSLKAPESQ